MTLKINGSMRLKKAPAEWLHEGANRHVDTLKEQSDACDS
jgi:hypothetical protein